ncbi:MAG: deoxyribose-phosphate aldolase [Spirochaetales bacterium]|nr:deoxyribose-phosphate aldolase [Spirochaetales bacterium]
MEINRYLDHAVLKPDTTIDEARKQIQSGIDYKVYSVCVRPCDIEMAKEMCEGTDTKVSVVLSFPHGCGHKNVKAFEAAEYCRLGVAEIDMVANYGLIRSGAYKEVVEDIEAVVKEAHQQNVLVKVILETTELTDEEITLGVKASIEGGADFVKTSTGFASGGASEEAVSLMLKLSSGKIKVKPSGGIRDRKRAELFVNMGVDRLGTGASSVEAICDDKTGTGSGY